MALHRKILLLVLMLGAVISTYLTVVEFAPQALYCPTTGVIDCSSVLNSAYAKIFGVPISLGALGWFVISILFLYRKPANMIRNVWLMIGFGGILFSILAMNAIGKICIYCSSLDVLILISIILFLYGKDLYKTAQ